MLICPTCGKQEKMLKMLRKTIIELQKLNEALLKEHNLWAEGPDTEAWKAHNEAELLLGQKKTNE